MCPARSFEDLAAAIEMMKARIAIGLQRAAKVLQVRTRMLAFAIRRVAEENRRRNLAARRPIVAYIGPEPPGLGPARVWLSGD